MKAFNVSFTLICEECGDAMQADRSVQKRGRILWSCQNKECIEYEKLYSQQLPQVSLTEIVQ